MGQNEVKICKLWSQNFKFLGQKIGYPNDHLCFATKVEMQIFIKHLF